MKKEFLDYIEDIIGAMEDAISFVKEMGYNEFAKDRRQFTRL